MFHTYEEALLWIHSRLRLGIKPGLTRMEWMMERLGHPEKEIKCIHIGGTNGKGSTLTFLRSILEEAGFKVGSFTSPYIEQFNERISMNGKPISDEEILKLANVIKPLSDELESTELGGPTEFEIITAMSFYYFANMGRPDFVIYEVGLGGRFDSTNIINPLLSLITNIGLDHTQILGDTYEEIAFEKAGIIKESTPIITTVKHEGALTVIREQARLQNAPFFPFGEEFSIHNQKSLLDAELFSFKSSSSAFEDLRTTMIGKHQTENAALAVMAAEYLSRHYGVLITESNIRVGLENAFWTGRFEKIADDPLVYVDGAHNDEGVQALVQLLRDRFPEKDIHIVFAALKDKKLDAMIEQLDEIATKITFVSFDFPRASSAEALFELSHSNSKFAVEDWRNALHNEIESPHNNKILIITGSLYFISEVKNYFCKNMKV